MSQLKKSIRMPSIPDQGIKNKPYQYESGE